MFKSLKNQKQVKKQRFVERGMYFIAKGDNQGAFILNIKEFDSTDSKAFLLMPNLERITIPKNSIPEFFQAGVLEYVHTLPSKVYNVCVEQYEALK